MILYLTIIFTFLLFLAGLNCILVSPILNISYGSVLFIVFTSFVFQVAVDGLIAFLAHRLPEKCIEPFRKFYVVTKKEKNFYEHLGVKHFKDYLPDLGWLCNFRKAKLEQPNNKQYIYKYMQESCYGELGHLFSLPFGYLVIFLYPLKYALYFGVPIATVNLILNLLPAISLRYNRYKLSIVYKRLNQIESRQLLLTSIEETSNITQLKNVS